MDKMTDEPVSEPKIEFPCDYPIKVIVEMRAGLVEEMLSPDLTDDFEMVHSTFETISSQ